MLPGSMRRGVLIGRILPAARREHRERFPPGLRLEALRQGWQAAVGQVKFSPFDAMHGKENDSRSEWLAVPDHYGEVLKGSELGSAQADSRGSQREDHSPELFSRVGQSCDDNGAGQEWVVCLGWGGRPPFGVLFHHKIVA